MSPRIRAVAGVAFMSVLLVLYFVFAGVRAVALLQSAEPIAIAMGVALLVLPLLGAWALVREIMFGFTSTKLVDALSEEGALPEELTDPEVTRGTVRDIADAAFPRYKEAAEADAADWRSYMRLGLVYDAAGDRKRARSAIRHAISLNRNEFRGIVPKN
ncbi:tetratricopeptide repeat protein [Leucobacter komagatae]|uniref:tetratricopeptide repeat protein n=1 Tax=Leucobacter komagatae TaxID=55969 RepID=UPI0005ACC583|nr:tetratricopeptide repeat protein [Leucobacter komagatae]